MYKLIKIISMLIRDFVLPNPYINIINNEVYADLFNIFIGEFILYILSYILTGCVYKRGLNSPASGSFGYFLSYCYLTGLITLLGYYISNINLFIILFLLLYILSCILVNRLFNRSML